jgi:hypothetical protein
LSTLRQIDLDRRVYRNHAGGGTGYPVVVQEEAMIVIIVISILALIGAAFTIYFRQRTSSAGTGDHVLPSPHFAGLFERTNARPPLEQSQQKIDSSRQKLLERATSGDLSVLDEAHATANSALYSDAFRALVEWASARQENLVALVSHVTKSNGLRANKQLAQQLIETWKTAPDRRSTTEMIHIAALSDDPSTYAQAIDEALDSWRHGKLAQFSAEELDALFVSQYWVIAPEARLGGVGFALKRKLHEVRSKLAAGQPEV